MYFADGIQEEILTRLSRIADLKVISRTSTQCFKNASAHLPDIAKQLGVANILEGSVRKAGDKVRVHVQLIDAVNDAHLWAERYDRELIAIFEVESDIAEKIAEALQAKLTGAERRAIATRPTQNTEAHDLYLKGKHQWRNFYAPGYERVREYFEQAIALDASFAPAYTGLSLYYSWAAANALFPPEVWPRAEEYVRKSLTWTTRWPKLTMRWRRSKFITIGIGLRLSALFIAGWNIVPNFADLHCASRFCLSYLGRFDEAIAQTEHGLQLDPFFPEQCSLRDASVFQPPVRSRRCATGEDARPLSGQRGCASIVWRRLREKVCCMKRSRNGLLP